MGVVGSSKQRSGGRFVPLAAEGVGGGSSSSSSGSPSSNSCRIGNVGVESPYKGEKR